MSDSSFYDAYDPFEYMTAQARRAEDVITEEEELDKNTTMEEEASI